MSTAPLRTSPCFVTWLCVIYGIVALVTMVYLFMTIPTFSYLWSDLVAFGCNFMFVVIAALVWPGTLLAMLI